MKEPRRLLDESAHGRHSPGGLMADGLMGAVLQAGLDVDPPPGAKDAMLRSIELAIGASVVGTAAHLAVNGSTPLASASTAPTAAASTVKVTAFKFGIVKIIGLAALSTAVIGGAAVLAKMLPRDSSRATEPSTAQATAAFVTDARATADVAPAPGTERPVAPSLREDASPDLKDGRTSSASKDASPSGDKPNVAKIVTAERALAVRAPAGVSTPPQDVSSDSKLSDESEAFAGARAKMRSGDAAGAVRALDDMQTRFGGGGLSQERATLYVEALSASGRASEARAYADAFIASHPSSVLAERMRPYATPPTTPPQ